METTAHLDRKGAQDSYSTHEACIAAIRSDKKQTNPRYESFRQNIFTVGDEEQFEQYRDARNYDVYNRQISLPSNCLLDYERIKIWNGFCDIKADSVIHTFRYIFNKMKKGIFVKIAQNELKVFFTFFEGFLC